MLSMPIQARRNTMQEIFEYYKEDCSNRGRLYDKGLTEETDPPRQLVQRRPKIKTLVDELVVGPERQLYNKDSDMSLNQQYALFYPH